MNKDKNVCLYQTDGQKVGCFMTKSNRSASGNENT